MKRRDCFLLQGSPCQQAGILSVSCEQRHPWKYQSLADAMMEILEEDECNDTYGRVRMYQALTLKQPENVDIPSECTVYRVMEEIGISHHPRCRPNGITKDREARKSDDLLKRDFRAQEEEAVIMPTAKVCGPE